MNTSYTRLTLADREIISRETRAQTPFAKIARMLGRPTSTVSREVWANVCYSSCYLAVRANERSERGRVRQRTKKLDTNAFLQSYVFAKLRREWSPEEIAHRL